MFWRILSGQSVFISCHVICQWLLHKAVGDRETSEKSRICTYIQTYRVIMFNSTNVYLKIFF